MGNTEKKVRLICKKMNINPKNIPVRLRPIYIPDKRYKKNPHRFYIFVLDAIANTYYDLIEIDNDIISTCVNELKHAGLIVLKTGRNDSTDYHDFIISSNVDLFYNWMSSKTKNKIELISQLVPDIQIGAA